MVQYWVNLLKIAFSIPPTIPNYHLEDVLELPDHPSGDQIA